MNIYLVLLDDWEAGWPEAIFDNKEDAVKLADSLKGQYRDYRVIEYILNKKEDNDEISQEVYCTRESWKLNHRHLL